MASLKEADKKVHELAKKFTGRVALKIKELYTVDWYGAWDEAMVACNLSVTWVWGWALRVFGATHESYFKRYLLLHIAEATQRLATTMGDWDVGDDGKQCIWLDFSITRKDGGINWLGGHSLFHTYTQVSKTFLRNMSVNMVPTLQFTDWKILPETAFYQNL